jgi:hypothetical protein
MGTVIQFPESDGARESVGGNRSEPATVIILPVIQIERYGDAPSGDHDPSSGASPRRRRRRRGTR